jgi:hypothetical protein
MKKYKKVIKVAGENVKDLFACSIVAEIHKLATPEMVETDEGLKVGETLSHVYVKVKNTRQRVDVGGYIVLDVCGHYEIMTAEEYLDHIDDEIPESSDDSGSDSTDDSTSKDDSSSSDEKKDDTAESDGTDETA